MRYSRYLLILMGVWLFLVDDIAGMVGLNELTPYAYILILACAVVPFLFPPDNHASTLVTFLTAVALLILLEVWGGFLSGSSNLLVIGVEISAIGLTLILASILGVQINAVQEVHANLGIGTLQKNVELFETGQGYLYREIRRARRYQRHAALLAISPSEASLQLLLAYSDKRKPTHQLIKNVQSEVWRKQALIQLAKLLVNEFGDSAIITQREEHFIVLFAEVGRAQCNVVVQQLQEAAQEKLGINLNIGVAIFPEEAVTFEMMLERAEAAMTGLVSHPGRGFMYEMPTSQPNSADLTLVAVNSNDETKSPVLEHSLS